MERGPKGRGPLVRAFDVYSNVTKQGTYGAGNRQRSVKAAPSSEHLPASWILWDSPPSLTMLMTSMLARRARTETPREYVPVLVGYGTNALSGVAHMYIRVCAECTFGCGTNGHSRMARQHCRMWYDCTVMGTMTALSRVARQHCHRYGDCTIMDGMTARPQAAVGQYGRKRPVTGYGCQCPA